MKIIHAIEVERDWWWAAFFLAMGILLAGMAGFALFWTAMALIGRHVFGEPT